MKSVILLLAYRYVWHHKHEHTLFLMIFITAISIFIGTFSLALVTSIMHGMEHTVHEKMKNIHPSATIYAQDPINVDAVTNVIKKEFPHVTALSPHAIGHVLITTPNAQDGEPIVAALKGIDPELESKVSTLNAKLTRQRTLVQSIHDNAILIGKELAHRLGLSIGDPISLLYIESSQNNQRKVTIEEHDAVIGGIFETGIDEYDAGVIYSTLPFFTTLFPDQGITQISLSFAHEANVPQLVHALAQRLSLEVHTWQDLYPALVSALVLEKYAMFFILLLITLVASMNIIALIFMLISHKKSDIAILCALGMGYQSIQRLFMLIGVGISFVAASFGVVAAWIISILLEKYPFIQLPDVYYVSHLPARMTFSIAAIVFIMVIFIAYVASWFATRRIQSINISHTLRFEG